MRLDKLDSNYILKSNTMSVSIILYYSRIYFDQSTAFFIRHSFVCQSSYCLSCISCTYCFLSSQSFECFISTLHPNQLLIEPVQPRLFYKYRSNQVIKKIRNYLPQESSKRSHCQMVRASNLKPSQNVTPNKGILNYFEIKSSS